MSSFKYAFLILYVFYITEASPAIGTSSLNLFNITDSSIQNDCPPFEPVPNGSVEIKSHIGSVTAIIKCHENYSLIGRSTFYCVSGVWIFSFDEAPPRCYKRCPPPPYLENGEVSLEKLFEDVYAPIGTYAKGTIAKYTCNKGFILEPASSSTRVCKNGHWTGSDAYCEPTVRKNCASPPVIEHGFIQPNFPVEYTVAFGEEVLYECFTGYKRIGVDRIKCTNLGVWSPEPPTCKEDGNPFADFSTPAPTAPVSNGMPDFFASQPATNVSNTQNMWGQNVPSNNAFQAPAQQPQPAPQQPFNDLTGFFNTNEPSVFDPLAPTDHKQAPVVPPQPSMPPQRPPQPSKILTGDLESSLNSLVENLTMDSGSGKWNSPKNQPKTSAAGGWQPQPMAATTAASYRPMMGAQQPQMMGQQPVMQPMMAAPMQYPVGAVQQPQMMGSPKMGTTATHPQQQTPFDPFGAL